MMAHDGSTCGKSNLASRTLKTIPWKYCSLCAIMELEKMTVSRLDAPKTAQGLRLGSLGLGLGTGLCSSGAAGQPRPLEGGALPGV